VSITVSAQQDLKLGKMKRVGLWTLIGFLSVAFVLSGTMKFIKPEVAEHFAQWGFADWFRVLIGLTEIAGGLALLAPRTTLYAAGALAVVMVGAVGTHVVHAEAGHAIAPLLLLGLLLTTGYARRPTQTRPAATHE